MKDSRSDTPTYTTWSHHVVMMGHGTTCPSVKVGVMSCYISDMHLSCLFIDQCSQTYMELVFPDFHSISQIKHHTVPLGNPLLLREQRESVAIVLKATATPILFQYPPPGLGILTLENTAESIRFLY